MHLLTRQDGRLIVTKKINDSVPRYAILSHTWGNEEDEVNFYDMRKGKGQRKTGFRKIEFCESRAQRDELDHFWIDTCCIDQSNAVEHQEAISLMYRWYQSAEKCYVFLSDVSNNSADEINNASTMDQFRCSRWFTRGWTLQELLAPPIVEFFSREGTLLGNKETLELLLHEITGIPIRALQGHSLADFPIEERLSWVAGRYTKRPEDRAYSLSGIFDIFMSPHYGEGEERALMRLRKKIDNLDTMQLSTHVRPISSTSTGLSQMSSDLLPVPTSANGQAVVMLPRPRVQCEDATCECICHIRPYYKTPLFLRKLMGAVTFRGRCQNHPAAPGEIKYSMPEWLTNYNMYVVFQKAANGMPSCGLRFQRKVAWGAEDTIIRFSLLGDIAGIKAILERGRGFLDDVDPNHGLTALHYAVQKNHIGACRLLLHAGSDRFVIDESNMSPTDKAWEQIFCNRGSPNELAILKTLFYTEDFDSWGFSAIHLAVLHIGNSSLEKLLEDGAPLGDIDSKDNRGRTALHWAALRGDLTATELLLNNGSEVDITDEFDCTPLTYAVSSAVPRMVELLILRRADVNVINKRGDTPLHYAARHKSDEETVKILVRAGARIEFKNKLGNTPFAGAAITNRVRSGEFLLGNGVNRYTTNKYGDTPLRETIHHNCHEFLEMLLRKGTRHNDINTSGSSILHAAALEGDLRTLVILSSFNLCGLDTNARNDRGHTAREVFETRMGTSDAFREHFFALLKSLSTS